jgi:hypothetical protein
VRKECRTQAELEAAIAAGDVPVLLGDGWFTAKAGEYVVARESSHVVAWGSSHVVARESSHVVAWGSSHVVARESSHVVAWGSSHVEARESSHVEASPCVAVHKHGPNPKIKGGVVIEVPKLDTPEKWCDFWGIKVSRGIATLYKAVNDDWLSGYKTSYAPRTKPEAPDWEPDGQCGGGLHFCAHPVVAADYQSGATKYLACPVRLDEVSVIDSQKVKAKRVVGKGCVEVDRYGVPV